MAPGTPTPHDGVGYRSRGMALVIGDSLKAVEAARELLRRAPTLRIALFVPGVGSVTELPSNITAIGGRIVSLQGHLGQFSASLRVAVDKVEDAGIFSVNEDRCFDLVLDLYREPLLRQSVLPYGYYAPGDDAEALTRALDSLSQLTGDFHKPKYFDYRPQLCAHGAMGVAGCTRCLDVCDTAAIRSTGEKIEVDPYLCQGCASCTLACPTGALSFQQPTPKALLGKLNTLLAERTSTADASILVVHDAATRHLLPAMKAPGVVLFEVNPMPAFSDVLWMTALVGGVSGVVLVMMPETPPQSCKVIEQKVHELNAILVSLGNDAAAIKIAPPMNLGTVIDDLKRCVRPSARAVAVNNNSSGEKRANLLAAVDSLAVVSSGLPCTLATGAAFGSVLVDPDKCTICLACTYLCPSGALSGQADTAPALYFKESLCVQCDVCSAGCPEKAIALQARFLPDAAAREASRELANDKLVPCSSCGTPFIGRRKLAVSLALMQEHAKDMPGGIDSLRMCPSCRQRETMMG